MSPGLPPARKEKAPKATPHMRADDPFARAAALRELLKPKGIAIDLMRIVRAVPWRRPRPGYGVVGGDASVRLEEALEPPVERRLNPALCGTCTHPCRVPLMASLIAPTVFEGPIKPDHFASQLGRFLEDFGPIQASSLEAILASALSSTSVRGADSVARHLSPEEEATLVEAFAICTVAHKPLSTRLATAIDVRMFRGNGPAEGARPARAAEVDALREGFREVVGALRDFRMPPAEPGRGSRAGRFAPTLLLAVMLGAGLMAFLLTRTAK